MRVYNYQLNQYHVMVDGQGRALMDSSGTPKINILVNNFTQWSVLTDSYISDLIQDAWGAVPMTIHESGSRFDYTFDYEGFNCEIDDGRPANFTVEDYA